MIEILLGLVAVSPLAADQLYFDSCAVFGNAGGNDLERARSRSFRGSATKVGLGADAALPSQVGWCIDRLRLRFFWRKGVVPEPIRVRVDGIAIGPLDPKSVFVGTNWTWQKHEEFEARARTYGGGIELDIVLLAVRRMEAV